MSSPAQETISVGGHVTHVAAADAFRSPVSLQLLGSFSLRRAARCIALGDSAARLIVLLALRRSPISRTNAARRLWPDVPLERGCANLRSVLWRLRNLRVSVVVSSGNELRLDPQVETDVMRVVEVAEVLLDRSSPLSEHVLSEALRLNFYEDLLPEWVEEEWLAPERERHRQLRLHCLEVLSTELSAVGWHGAAVHTALAVIDADPLRESGHEVLVRAHLAAGNRTDALRRFRHFRRLLLAELGVEPRKSLRALVSDTLVHSGIRATTAEKLSERVRENDVSGLDCCQAVE